MVVVEQGRVFMKVLLARSAGFCMGVRRAVETTLDTIRRQEEPVVTFGPLIHNPQVLELLAERGVEVMTEMPMAGTGTVIIRAHGVPPARKEELRNSGVMVKDATCPRVLRVQAIIRKYRKQGYGTVIIGDRNHAEVEGLMGYAGSLGQTVSCEADITNLQLPAEYIIVSQTTQDENVFADLSRLIVARFPGGKVFDTICDSTHKRQDEARKLCKKVEAVVVVGGKNSANTQRLGEIVEGMGRDVFVVETEEELDPEVLRRYDCVGVTAGASTPNWLIHRVVRTLESIPGPGEGLIRPLIYKFLWWLLVTNILVGLAGGALSFICGVLQGIRPQVDHFLVSFFYIFGMYNLNRLTDRKAKKFSDPLRANFYERHHWRLLMSAILSLAAALIITSGLGSLSLWGLAVMTLPGVLCSGPLSLKLPSGVARVLRMKIPGARTFIVGVAWAFVATLIPAMADKQQPAFSTPWVLVMVTLLVFVRNILIDVFEVQSDRIVGKDTLPVCIGKGKTLVLLYGLMGVVSALSLLLSFKGIISPLGVWLIPGILYLIVLAGLYQKNILRQGPTLEFLLEIHFLLAAGFIWLGIELGKGY